MSFCCPTRSTLQARARSGNSFGMFQNDSKTMIARHRTSQNFEKSSCKGKTTFWSKTSKKVKMWCQKLGPGRALFYSLMRVNNDIFSGPSKNRWKFIEAQRVCLHLHKPPAKIDYNPEEEEKEKEKENEKEDRFRRFNLRRPDVKSASRKNPCLHLEIERQNQNKIDIVNL